MALSNGLADAGHQPERLEVTSTVSFDMVDGAPTVTESKLTVRGKVPDIDEAAFLEAARDAEQNCPVSRALRATSRSRSTRSSRTSAARPGHSGGSAQFEFEPSPSSSTARNASCGTSMRPTCFMRFLPSFWRSSSLRLREMSPP